MELTSRDFLLVIGELEFEARMKDTRIAQLSKQIEDMQKAEDDARCGCKDPKPIDEENLRAS